MDGGTPAAPAGAVLEHVDGRSLPAWYGLAGEQAESVAREHAAARRSAAVADLGDRGVLAVTGPLRQKFLHGLLSQDVASRQPGQGCPAALMDVKGRVLALMRVLVSTDAIDLEMPESRLETVEKVLVHYRVAAPVRFTRRPVGVVGLVGPAAREVLARAGTELPDLGAEDHVATSLAGHPVRVARGGDLPAGGFVVHAEPAAAADVWGALAAAGAVPLGRRALDVLRVEDGRPWYGPDVTEDNLLHETGLLLEYHSSTKGCYVGQEVVARLAGRGGNVSRALRGLRLAGPAEPGATVSAGGRDVGRVTTAAESPRLGPIAMAYVHRNHFEPGSAVEVAGVAATVALLPLEDER